MLTKTKKWIKQLELKYKVFFQVFIIFIGVALSVHSLMLYDAKWDVLQENPVVVFAIILAETLIVIAILIYLCFIILSYAFNIMEKDRKINLQIDTITELESELDTIKG